MIYQNLIAITLLSLFYLLALVVDRTAGSIFVLLILIALISLACSRSHRASFKQICQQYWPLHLTMAGPLLAVLAHQIGAGDFHSRGYDLPSRIAFFVFIFWLLQCLPLRYLKMTQWAIITGIAFATIKMYALTLGGSYRYGTDFIPIIIYGEMCLLLGFFAIFSIGWNRQQEKLTIVLKVLACCSGLLCAYWSLSRGVWATIPIVLIIAYSLFLKISDHRGRLILIFASAILVLAGFFSHEAQTRIDEAKSDINEYIIKTYKDTSLGQRFQIWHGSWILFTQHPIVGIGAEHFSSELEKLAQQKIISPIVATLPHSHNDILFMMTKFGIFGLIAILALYFVPLYYFAQAMHRHQDKEIRCTAAMGLILCLSFFVLGLVDVIFMWWELYPFYAINIALFLTVIIKRQQEIRVPAQY